MNNSTAGSHSCGGASETGIKQEEGPDDTDASGKPEAETIKDKELTTQVPGAILLYQQHVLFDGKQGRDGPILRELNDQTTSTRDWNVCGHMQILVEMRTSETKTLDVEPTFTVRDVESKIQDKLGILSEQQCLIYNSKQLESTGTLNDYEIPNKSILYLARELGDGMEILVETQLGRTLFIKVALSDTIEIVKRRIQEKEGIPPYQQCLMLSNQMLEDGCTLGDYNIHVGSTLCLTGADVMRIFVKTLAGKKTTLEVQESTSIRVRKKRNPSQRKHSV